MIEALNGIAGKHVIHALLIGIAAGVIAQALNQYVVNSLETSIGVPPSGLF